MDNINLLAPHFQSCIYSDRLLGKLLLLNESAKDKIDIEEVKKAIYYSKKYHGNQKRQSGEPYYSHPLEIAYRMADYCFKTNVIISAILHDTIEDTEITEEIIQVVFGELVARQVELLTRIKIDRKISSAEMLELAYQQKDPEVLLIKLFDRLHNIETIGAKSPEKAKKVVDETISAFIVLAAYLGIRDIEEKLVQLCSDLAKQDSPYEDYDILRKTDAELLSLVFQNDEDRK